MLQSLELIKANQIKCFYPKRLYSSIYDDENVLCEGVFFPAFTNFSLIILPNNIRIHHLLAIAGMIIIMAGYTIFPPVLHTAVPRVAKAVQQVKSTLSPQA